MKTKNAATAILVTAALSWVIPSTSAAPGDEIWSFTAGRNVFSSPAMGPQGGVFFGTQEGGTTDQPETDGHLYALNPDGSLRWRFSAPSDWIDAAPVVSQEGTVFAASWDGTLYAVEADSGQLLWQFNTTGPIVSAPAIHRNTVFLTSTDGFLYALNATTGQEIWSFLSTDSYSPIAAPPVLADDGSTAFFGDDGGFFHAVNTTDGSLRWSFNTTAVHPPDASTEPAIVAPAALDAAGNPYFTSKNGRLYALEAASGNLRWSFPAAEGIMAAPAIKEDGTVLFPSKDGYLYGLDLEGFQLFETFVGDVFYCSPAVDTQGNIIIAAYSGSAAAGVSTTVFTLDSTGTPVWEFAIPAYNDSSPVIAPDGSVYIGAQDGTLYKLEGTAPPPDQSSAWPAYMGSRTNSGQRPSRIAPTLLDVFPDILFSEDGYAHLDGLGTGGIRTAPSGLPWLQHQNLGWFAHLRSDSTSVWLYHVSLAQPVFHRYADPDLFFLAEDRHWLRQPINQPSWLFNYSTSRWLSP